MHIFNEKDEGDIMRAILLNEIESWLQDNGWKYKKRQEAEILEMDVKLQCGLEQCRVIVWMTEEYCVVVGRTPVKVEEEARGRIGEYVCRANYSMYDGHFDFNYDDGELRYKTILPQTINAGSRPEMIEEMLMRPAVMLDTYGPGFLKVWKQEEEPAEVIKDIDL